MRFQRFRKLKLWIIILLYFQNVNKNFEKEKIKMIAHNPLVNIHNEY
ncbi:hypothetical protein BCAH820_1920 [Bacillus cereus AH820]|uniref:Uncharacterized protein n=1 Tax=Bacillus cereus (strain AH820) TaxID=405535 RepID=B7JJJ7_BACC0|nr:hypothetical protein BCAH820_1920 [Bacillus cereus AH820]EDX66545.1 hypothetical protein BC059799_1863 [Bacillus cereus NVH0597-99]KLA14205.1 hypothetical protein B4087_1665 [Bacillus cereus]